MSSTAEMERLPLGDDGYTTARLIVGGWQLSAGHREDAVDEAELFAGLASAARAGWTTFDCADIYTGVEELFGRFRAAHAADLRADGIELGFHTKYVPDLDALGSLDRAAVEAVIDRSLTRLGVERLDLVQFSWWDYAVPGYVEVAQWLTELRDAGKIRHVGATNFDTPRMREMLDAGVPLVSNQVQYSLLDRRPERELVELAEERGVGLICYGALAGGLLTGKHLGAPPLQEPFANRSLVKYRLIVDEVGGWERYQALLRTMKRVGLRHSRPFSDVALRWVLDRPAVTAAMVGTFDAQYLFANLFALTLSLTDEDCAEIDEALAQLDDVEGDVFGLERVNGGPHSTIMWKNIASGRR
ncbi:MAG: aldo/keto reductase [Planctomycetota bacterium]